MAFTFYPFIIKSKLEEQDTKLMNHEKIHLAQQKELWIIPFYILYLIDLFYGLIRYLDLAKAYALNMFEIEAYGHENDAEYLSTRKRFQPFLKDTAEMEYYIVEVEGRKNYIATKIASALLIAMIVTFIILLVM